MGTCDLSPPKNLALEIIVSCAKVFTRVRDTKEEPGSLKAMWPSAPIPANVEKDEECTQHYTNTSQSGEITHVCVVAKLNRDSFSC